MTLQIEGKDVNFLLDMGVAFSVLPFRLGPLDSQTKMVIGVDGKLQSWNFTKPLHCKVGNWQGTHPFLYKKGLSKISLVALLPYWGETFFAASKPE